MSFFALSHEAGTVIYEFLSQDKIRQMFSCFPVKIEIPINFSLYLDIQVSSIAFEVPEELFSSHLKYERRRREDFQKTLSRKEKRMAMVKIFT